MACTGERMNAADKPAFVATLNGLAAMKPGAKLTPEALDLWWLTLIDWSIEDFTAAARHLAGEVEFFPNPYHFIQLRKTANESSAGEAWAKVLEAVRTMNPREGAKVDPKIDAVVRQMGGYQHLACMTSEEMPWRMKRFTELWADVSDVEEAQLALPSAGGGRLAGPQKAAVPRLVRAQ